MGKQEVTIDRDEYIQLLIHREILNQLEINGVDNWEGYGCMCYGHDEECIFCTEDEEEYLGIDNENV